MTTAQVTMILPVHNGEHYLAESLERIARIGYENFSVVIVDDGSIDKTPEILAREAEPRGHHVVTLPENQGVAAARRRALSLATGEYVWFVDVDDEWDDAFLPTMVGAIEESGADLALCSAWYQYGTDASEREPVATMPRAETLRGLDAVETLLAGTGALWNKLFRRSALARVEIPKLRSKSDHALILSMLPHVESVVTVPAYLYTYMMRPDSISNGKVAMPENFLALLPLLEKSFAAMAPSPRGKRLETTERYVVLGRAARECWKFDGVSPQVAEQIRRLIHLGELPHVAWWDKKTVPTCVLFKMAPGLGSRVFKRLTSDRRA